MEPYRGCNNAHHCGLSFGICICIALFNVGIVIIESHTSIGVSLIASSIGLFILIMCIGLFGDIIKRRKERRNLKANMIVQYNIPKPPIVIIQPDNTYCVGTPIEEHPRPIYTTIPMYVAIV